jgi:hypothetical protein
MRVGGMDVAAAFAVRLGVVGYRGRGRVPVPDGTGTGCGRGKPMGCCRRCEEAALSLDRQDRCWWYRPADARNRRRLLPPYHDRR